MKTAEEKVVALQWLLEVMEYDVWSGTPVQPHCFVNALNEYRATHDAAKKAAEEN
jgi:hypothetical protein